MLRPVWRSCCLAFDFATDFVNLSLPERVQTPRADLGCIGRPMKLVSSWGGRSLVMYLRRERHAPPSRPNLRSRQVASSLTVALERRGPEGRHAASALCCVRRRYSARVRPGSRARESPAACSRAGRSSGRRGRARRPLGAASRARVGRCGRGSRLGWRDGLPRSSGVTFRRHFSGVTFSVERSGVR